MNTRQTEDMQIWVFVLVAVLFLLVTMSAILLKITQILRSALTEPELGILQEDKKAR